MNRAEVEDLLLNRIAPLDNRVLTPETVSMWHELLYDVAYEDARAAVLIFFRTPGHGYLMPANLIEIVQGPAMPRSLVSHDVRVARNLGIVPKSWPESQPLEAEHLAALAQARAAKIARIAIEAGEPPEAPPALQEGTRAS